MSTLLINALYKNYEIGLKSDDHIETICGSNLSAYLIRDCKTILNGKIPTEINVINGPGSFTSTRLALVISKVLSNIWNCTLKSATVMECVVEANSLEGNVADTLEGGKLGESLGGILETGKLVGSLGGNVAGSLVNSLAGNVADTLESGNRCESLETGRLGGIAYNEYSKANLILDTGTISFFVYNLEHHTHQLLTKNELDFNTPWTSPIDFEKNEYHLPMPNLTEMLYKACLKKEVNMDPQPYYNIQPAYLKSEKEVNITNVAF